MKNNKKVLIIVSHPDDAELAMGMRIVDFVSKGYEVFVHCLSQGSVNDPKIKETRIGECKKAKEILEIKEYTFADITDTQFVAERVKINQELFNVMQRIRPNIVFTHYPEDQHLDHRITSEEVLVVAEREVPNIIYFQSPYTKNMKVSSYFFGNNKLMQKKQLALECFESQKQFNIKIVKDYSSIAYYQLLHHRIIRDVNNQLNSDPIFSEFYSIERQIKF
jgi:LmbE family N-acetylglucosaminyl deacetylase